MGYTYLWIYATIIYGLSCGAVYTWMTQRHAGIRRLFLRSAISFSIAGLIIVYILFRIFKA